MRNDFYIAPTLNALLVLLISCVGNNNSHHNQPGEQRRRLKVIDTAFKDVGNVIRFKSINQLYQDTSSTKWTDEGSFWWLYFEPGKVFFDFNPSCGYWFPTRLIKDKIVFYWANNMNCTFNR